MSKSYRHIKQYKKELLELKTQGITVREIGNNSVLVISKHMNFSNGITGIKEKLKKVK